MIDLSRRALMIGVGAVGGAALLGGCATTTTSAAVAEADPDTPWRGEKIVDCHFHDRPTDEALLAHMDGAGVSNGFVLAGSDFSARMARINAGHPGRISGWGQSSILAADGEPTGPGIAGLPRTSSEEAAVILRKAVGAGATAFGETVGVVPVDGPELRRLYALAAELDVAIMMHFQEMTVPNLPRYGITGFSRIEPVLRAFPKTRFVCHASDFWGHIDANYTDGGAYPTGKVNRGGLVERLLTDYPNMHADLGAPSGLIQLSRDPEFTAGFLERHQDKLVFGSDCGCPDGRGGTTAGAGTTGMQARMAQQGGLAGKCIAREVLKIAWNSTDRRVFRKLVWHNAKRVYRLPG